MSDVAVQSGLFDRALRRVTSLWRDMADRVSGAEEDSIEAQMRACLNGRGGEVSARNRAAKLAQAYLALDAEGRLGLPAQPRRLRFRSGRGPRRDRARWPGAADAERAGRCESGAAPRRWSRRGCGC